MKKIWFIIPIFIFCITTVKADYFDEYPSAYTRAFKNWITTQTTIDKADMYWDITRIALSKMISNYAINVLNKKPDTTKKCEFTDISDKLNKQYDSWVTKACQLWLMWQWITKFRPYDNVTRAEFGTILSRLLWWDEYNWWNPYYKKHLNQLNIRWIMTSIKNAENLMELRGNVMVMLKRSESLWDIKIPSFDELDDVVYDKCPSDFDWYNNIYKKSFIIPYKDWYIWYDYWWQEWWWIYLTYKDINKPCNNISESDTIFWYGGYIEDKEHPLTNVYISIWNWNSRRTEEVIKKLNCTLSKEIPYDNCDKELNRYIYNLIVWKEEQEYFTQWITKFKKDIDNNKFTNYSFRQERWKICNDKINKEFESLKDSLDWYELENRRLNKEHQCAIEYLKS